MPFVSERQRAWFFANRGKYKSSSKSFSKRTKKFIPVMHDPVKTLYTQNTEALNSAVESANEILKTNPEYYEKVKQFRASNTSNTTKISPYKNPETGEYTLERQKIHNRLVDMMDNPNAIAKNSQPKIVFLGGLTASGKTSVVSKQKSLGYMDDNNLPEYKRYKDFVYLNSDEFKTKFPEYTGLNASDLHEESVDVLNIALDKYSKERKNIILDSTLKTYENAKANFELFKRKGYKVILLGTNIKGENSIIRSAYRALNTGRFVEFDYIKNNAEKTNKSVLKLRHSADKYKIYNNDVKFGEKPKLIESTESINSDRKNTSNKIVETEEEWRQLGVNKADLKGYDTKQHVKIEPEDVQ
jgi:predicted ABC-type ATPase